LLAISDYMEPMRGLLYIRCGRCVVYIGRFKDYGAYGKGLRLGLVGLVG